MSFDTNWNVNKYRDEHESDEHWGLRKAFMERWKDDYPEERLVCLARVFSNIELMGCRYPSEVMKEVARLSYEVAKDYRNIRKTKLQRTFVSASDAAEDRAKGIKREGGVIVDSPAPKSSKIAFVKQGQSTSDVVNLCDSDSDSNVEKNQKEDSPQINSESTNDITEDKPLTEPSQSPNEYLEEMLKVKCLDIRSFNDNMFTTTFGRFVLFIRPWTSKLSNITSSCQVCRLPITSTYEKNCFTLMINNNLVARATGPTKVDAKSIVEMMAWNRLREEAVSILVKEQWIAQGDRISLNDVSSKREEFGTPIENSVATKMMKLMGWKGGGLGADSQGIEEPIKPHLQMVNRAGLGSNSTDIRQLRRLGQDLMRRYIASDSLDVDLVFSAEFSKEERALLHTCAQRAGLASRSYGSDADRFLVVKKKIDPFSLFHAVLEKGGNTPKYQVFIPAALQKNHR